LDLDLVVRRHELTDEQWQIIEPLLPVSGAKGRPRVDDRRVINGMLFKAKTGVAWRDLPERYGPWKTVYNRFWRWSRNGTLAALLEQHPVGKQQGRRPGVGMKATTKVKAQGHQAAEEVG
jgi:hypothetical protein